MQHKKHHGHHSTAHHSMEHKMHSDRGHHSEGIKEKNHDRGPPMIEGAHHFDKGYESDAEVFARSSSYPDDHERGNSYVNLNREIIHRDSSKLDRSKFSKIA